MLIEAPTVDGAYDKTIAWAQQHEAEARGGLKFYGIEDIEIIGEEELGDGTEIGGYFSEESADLWHHRAERVPDRHNLPGAAWEQKGTRKLDDVLPQDAKRRLKRMFSAD